jgi:hypothetical protein
LANFFARHAGVKAGQEVLQRWPSPPATPHAEAS